jgi:hypothetical protein
LDKFLYLKKVVLVVLLLTVNISKNKQPILFGLERAASLPFYLRVLIVKSFLKFWELIVISA